MCGIYVRVEGRVSEGVVGECECRRLIEVVTGEASDAAAECDYLGT